jgi:thiamine-monophosphate kinase
MRILPRKQKKLGELELIDQIRSSAAGPGIRRRSSSLALGIGDDCAILRPPRGHEILVTTDFSLEGRHFRRDLHSPESVGHRALARGLSDLAAMGAHPLAAFLSLALPAQLLATASGRRWVDRFFAGLHALAAEHNVPLAGGDTAESPADRVLADIVLVGSAPIGRSLRRSGARAGDALYVTGRIGGSAAEFASLQRRATRISALPKGPGEHPHLFPQPRIAVGRALLRRHLASAAIDLSDGLSTDLAHLCRESSLGAEVSAAALPIHPLAAHAGHERSLELALNGGEDYELLFAAPAKAQMPRSIAGVPITWIGELVAGRAITLIDPSGTRQALQPAGWEHFK